MALAVHRLKHSFVSNLWSWNSLYIGEELSSLIGFLEWVAPIEGLVRFFLFLLLFVFGCLNTSCMLCSFLAWLMYQN